MMNSRSIRLHARLKVFIVMIQRCYSFKDKKYSYKTAFVL